MNQLLITITILLIFCSVICPQNDGNQVVNLFDGRLKIIPLYKTQFKFLHEINNIQSDAKRKILIESLYKPHRELWESYVRDEEYFFKWIHTSSLKKLDEYQAKVNEIEIYDLPHLLEATALKMSTLTGHFPQGKWYLVFGPGYTDLGGLGNGIMLVDFSNKNINFDHIKFLLPHEFNHQIYDKTNPSDPNSATGLYRIINKGFASYINYIYWDRKYSPAKNLLYSEEEFQWCMNHEIEIFLNAEKYFFSRTKADTDNFGNRMKKLMKNGPGAIGYFIGFRICEKYVEKFGDDSWKDIYTMNVLEILNKSKG
jgi:uncharacterized protein YjaZ